MRKSDSKNESGKKLINWITRPVPRTKLIQNEKHDILIYCKQQFYGKRKKRTETKCEELTRVLVSSLCQVEITGHGWHTIDLLNLSTEHGSILVFIFHLKSLSFFCLTGVHCFHVMDGCEFPFFWHIFAILKLSTCNQHNRDFWDVSFWCGCFSTRRPLIMHVVSFDGEDIQECDEYPDASSKCFFADPTITCISKILFESVGFLQWKCTIKTFYFLSSFTLITS